MSNEDNSDNPNPPTGTPPGTPGGTAPGAGGPAAPPACTPALSPIALTVTGSATITGLFDFNAAARAYADMIRVLGTFKPMLCGASCPPPCSCIPVPTSFPTYWVSLVNKTVAGVTIPVPTLNVSQTFQAFCY